MRRDGGEYWPLTRLNYKRGNYLKGHPESALLNAKTVTGAGAKFTGYLFSPDDNDGRGKGLFNDFDDFGAPSSGPFGEDEEREVEVDG